MRPLVDTPPLGPLLDVAPELGPHVERLLAEGASPHQLFHGVLGALVDPSQPTLLVIEDAHWADEATLDALRFLARRVQPLRRMMVVTYRGDEVGSKLPFRIVMGDIATGSVVRGMTLPVLSEQAVARVVRGSLIDPAELYRLTGGNPFHVTEHGIRERGEAERPACGTFGPFGPCPFGGSVMPRYMVQRTFPEGLHIPVTVESANVDWSQVKARTPASGAIFAPQSGPMTRPAHALRGASSIAGVSVRSNGQRTVAGAAERRTEMALESGDGRLTRED